MSNLNKLTKAELIKALQTQGQEVVSLRHRVSVLEGAKQLSAAPVVRDAAHVVISGVEYLRVVERHGQSTRTRLIPAAIN